MQHYYRAVYKLGSWRAQVYTYDDSGNQIIVVYESTEEYNSMFEAVDAAVEWAEDNNINVELG